MAKEKTLWRVVQYEGYVFLVSPDGFAHRQYGLAEAEAAAKEENARLEVTLLAREGKI